MEQKQSIFNLTKDGKSIKDIAQTLAIATTWNVLKKTETIDVLSNIHSTCKENKENIHG